MTIPRTPIFLAAYAVAALLLFALAWWWITEPGRQRQRAAEARADAIIAGSQTKAARDAVGVVTGAAERERQIDDTTRRNQDAILSAPGAGQAVDPGVADAGLRALCLRQSAARDPACQRLLDARSR